MITSSRFQEETIGGSTQARKQPREAFLDFLATLKPKNGSREIWFKHGHDQFLFGEWDESGRFPLHTTKKTGEDASTRVRTGLVSEDAYRYLRALSEQELKPNAEGKLPSGGIFYIPTQPQGFPGKDAIDSTDDLGCEMDAGTREEQLEKWREFTRVTRLYPSSLLTSGGKSVHCHIKLTEHYPIVEAQYLRRLLAIGMIGDAAVTNAHQPMRIPGFYRVEKNAEQELLYSSQHRYTYDEAVAGLKIWFNHVGFAFPDRITDTWWQHLKRLLKIAEKQGDKAPLLTALSEGIDEWERKQQEQQAIRDEKRARVANLESSGLFNQVQELIDRLGSSAFERRHHRWVGTDSHKRGSCTFHPSESNSAWIRNKDGRASFHCPTCTYDKPLDAFGYWLSDRRNEITTQYPQGREWAELAKEFLRDHGITPSEYDRPKGFKTEPGGAKQNEPEQSERDRLIHDRSDRFRSYWNGLRKDFQLSPIIAGVEAQIEYDGYCPIFDLLADTIAVQGWLGAGKTEAMLRSLLPMKNKTIVWVSPSNGLNRQTAERARRMGFDVYHYQDDVSLHRAMMESGQPGIYFMCPDSFKEYAVSGVKWANTVLAIDEFSGIRKSLHSKTLELPQIKDAIAQCGLLIAADAFLADADIALIRKLRSESIVLYRQKPAKSAKPIKFIETCTKDGEISFSHDSIYLGLLDSWIDVGVGRIAIAVDSILYAKVLKVYLESKGVKVWLACSETPEENAIFMPRPDATIVGSQSQVVIYTPTAKSGLDIQTPFDRGLLICCGVLPPTEMLQMLGRCRQCAEWWVSAPRRTANSITPSLDGKQIRKWAEQISATFEELGINAPASLQGWGVWESVVSSVERAFGSEYIHALLQEYFELVETIEVDSGDVMAWRNAIVQIQIQDAENRLNANLENGQRLIDSDKQPAKNSEVWDVKLAQLHAEFPKLTEKLIEDHRSSDADRMIAAIDYCKVLTSRRIKKLKQWIIAEDRNPKDDLYFAEYLRERATTYNSGAFRARQNTALYRSLKLADLAKCSKTKQKSIIANENAFNMRSPVFLALWEQFQRDRDLRKLFPMIETPDQLWGAIRSCLTSFGFQSVVKKQRVETEGLNPNGKDRNGNQRLTKSKVEHFIGWLLMEFSGNAFFKENFDLIIEAIRDRIDAERLEREIWRSKRTDPDIPIAA